MSDADAQNERKGVLEQALKAIDALQAKVDTLEGRRAAPIAIVGLSCRFPGAGSARDYWHLLRDGRDAVTEVPGERWDKHAFLDPDPASPGKMTAAYGGFMDGIEQFDASFFGIAGREAKTMDPQQRILLEVAWEALEHANLPAPSLRDSLTGVYVGITTMDYGRMAISSPGSSLDVYTATGSALNVAAGRIAYTLGLTGPAAAIDTACSSSLVALHMACQSLRVGECDAALAGGVNVLLAPEPFVCFAKWGMMAPDGRCKTFDEAADGFVRSEGCGVVVLKRLADAIASGDRVLGVIRGSAINQDGASSGLTVPNGLSQQAVVRAALDRAGLDPHAVDYVEAHGTGTSLGDPIELEALAEVLAKKRSPQTPLYVGSVKTNIGHTESASGIAGLIKVVLSLQNEQIPAHLHYRKLNPNISLGNAPVTVTASPVTWPRGDRPRIAGVSSFGFSGTNAHVILEEAPGTTATTPSEIRDRNAYLLPLSARSSSALHTLAGACAEMLADPDLDLGDVCHTAACGRSPMAERAVFVEKDTASMRDALTSFATGAGDPRPNTLAASVANPPKIAFLFTGQGSQYPQMGRFLYEAEPVFRQVFDRCAELTADRVDIPLQTLLGYDGDGSDQAALLNETRYTQPALFAFEYALAELWRSWGVSPAVVLGHSLGEIVAACVAGVLSLEDALTLVVERAQLMNALPDGGAMTAILTDEKRVQAAIDEHGAAVSIAAINGPANVVVSGRRADVDAVAQVLGAQGVETRPLAVSHAFHSALVDPMLDEFERKLVGLNYNRPNCTVVSNVTGAVLGDDMPMDAAYWRRHAREGVRFADSIATARGLGVDAFVEIGPAPVLITMARLCFAEATDDLWLMSMRQDDAGYTPLLASLGALYARGAPVDLRRLDDGRGRKWVDLPSYPFQRKRYWLSADRLWVGSPENPLAGADAQPVHPLLGRSVASPVNAAQYSGAFDAARFPVLLEHNVAGQSIVPAAAYIEAALAAAKEWFGTDDVASKSGWLRSALKLDADHPLDISLVLTPDEGRDSASARFEVFSRALKAGPEVAWDRHAGGRVCKAGREPVPKDFRALIEHCTEAVDIAAYREAMKAVGLDYGPAFLALTDARRGEQEAYGELRLPAETTLPAELRLHPGLLDAAFHLIGLALPETSDGRFYLPVAYESVESHRSLGASGHAHAQLRQLDAARVKADVTVWRGDGALAARIEGLEARAVTAAEFRKAVGETRVPQLAFAWREVEKVPATPCDCLVIGGDDGGQAALVAQALQEAHSDVQLVDEHDALRRLQSSGAEQRVGLVDLRPLSVVAQNEEAQPTAEFLESALLDTVLMLQRLAASPPAADVRCAVVTRAAQAVTRGEPIEPPGAVLWGVAASASTELPNVSLRLIDVDETTTGKRVAEAIWRDDRETQLAIRGDVCFCARLTANAANPTDLVVPDGAYELAMRERGTLTGLAVAPATKPAAGPGQVEIEVLASGLNFRDVLNLLDMYPGPAGPLGNECCGRVVSVGPGVEGLEEGDLVACISNATFDSHVVAEAAMVFKVPPALSIAQAAVFLISQLTVCLALRRIGRIESGDWVLVHAGAGGVGLAAVHLALASGARVIATAGSDEKRQYLRDIGVHATFDSRSLLAAEEVRAATGGHGVDLVLNSLTGDFIDEGIRSLARGGRFLEIGLRELRSEDEVAALRSDVEYHSLLLGDWCRDEPDTVASMYQEMVELVAAQKIPAPTVRTFPLAEAGEAFEFMAKAKHIGRIALLHPAAGRGGVRADAAYLITGGLGSLGLEVAEWLAEQGAGRVALLGRSAPSEIAAQRIERLRESGVDIDVVAGDVTRQSDLAFLAERDSLPYRGIVHAAGIVDDAPLARLDADRIARVLSPKADGVINLARSVEAIDLDFFVAFSSGSAVLGSAGQAAYAGANAFLDAATLSMRHQGRAALTINWGAWEGDGMAGSVDERVARSWAERGIGTLSKATGLGALEEALASRAGRAVVVPIRWETFFATATEPIPLLLTELAPSTLSGEAAAAPQRSDLSDELSALSASKRERVLVERLREETAGVLGVQIDEIDARTGLTEQGMDSLMAVELASRLSRVAGVALPSTFAFEFPTLAALGKHLLVQLLPSSAEADADAEETLDDSKPGTETVPHDQEIEDLSEAELQDELRRELEQAGF